MGQLPKLHALPRSPQEIQSERQETVQAALALFNGLQRLAFHTVVKAMVPAMFAESLHGLGGPSTATQPTTRIFFLEAPGELAITKSPRPFRPRYAFVASLSLWLPNLL